MGFWRLLNVAKIGKIAKKIIILKRINYHKLDFSVWKYEENGLSLQPENE